MAHSNLTVLALDLGNKTGCAIWRYGELVSVEQKTIKHSSPLKIPGERIAIFRDYLGAQSTLLNTLPSDRSYLIVEKPFHLQGHAIASLYGYFTIAKIFAFDHDMTFKSYSPMTVKKHLSGSGKASKARMIEAAEDRWSIQVNTSDEADSLGLLSLFLEEHEDRYPSSL